jgi:hypothetical protein
MSAPPAAPRAEMHDGRPHVARRSPRVDSVRGCAQTGHKNAAASPTRYKTTEGDASLEQDPGVPLREGMNPRKPLEEIPLRTVMNVPESALSRVWLTGSKG